MTERGGVAWGLRCGVLDLEVEGRVCEWDEGGIRGGFGDVGNCCGESMPVMSVARPVSLRELSGDRHVT